MPGRTESEAADAYRDPIATALACIADGSRFQFRRYVPIAQQTSGPIQFTLDNANEVHLGGEQNVKLHVSQHVVFVDSDDPKKPLRMSTRGYMYLLATDRVMINWHWHPKTSASRNVDPSIRPHVHTTHLEIDTGKQSKIARLHVPTGRVAIEQVVRYAIEELGVKALNDDWNKLITESEALHIRHRGWHSSPRDVSIPAPPGGSQKRRKRRGRRH